MNKAKVLWFNDEKGFGYCQEEASGEEIFIHYSTIESKNPHKTLKSGQTIYIEVCSRNNKLCADKIYLLIPKKKDKKKSTRTNSNSLSI